MMSACRLSAASWFLCGSILLPGTSQDDSALSSNVNGAQPATTGTKVGQTPTREPEQAVVAYHNARHHQQSEGTYPNVYKQ